MFLFLSTSFHRNQSMKIFLLSTLMLVLSIDQANAQKRITVSPLIEVRQLATLDEVSSVKDKAFPRMLRGSNGVDDFYGRMVTEAVCQDFTTYLGIQDDIDTVIESVKNKFQDELNDLIASVFEGTSGSEISDGLAEITADLASDLINNQVMGYKGSVIEESQGQICGRLPLKDDTCYYKLNGAADPLEVIIDYLGNRFIPFYAEMVAAREAFENLINDIKAVFNTVDPREIQRRITEFFLGDQIGNEVGTCSVFTKDTFAIADQPGFPKAEFYDFANCKAMKAGNPPPFKIQPYIRGIGFSTATDPELVLDGNDLSTTKTFYDGFGEFDLNVQGNFWLNIDILAKVPKMGKSDPNSLICKPSQDPKENKRSETQKDIFPSVDVKTAVLVNVPQGDDNPELEFFAAVQSINMKFKVLNFEIGSGYAALRMYSKNPQCDPSGLFGNFQVQPTITTGGLIGFLLKEISPMQNTGIKFGITWKDGRNLPVSDRGSIQSVFFEYKANLKFLGIEFSSINLEFHYIDENEFSRRLKYDVDICCAGKKNCGIVQNPLTQWINSLCFDENNNKIDNCEKPTAAIFFRVDNTYFGIMELENLQFQFLIQFDNVINTRLVISAHIKILFVDIGSSVLVEIRDGLYVAEFKATVEIDLDGFGSVGATLVAKANNLEASFGGSRQLQTTTDLDELQYYNGSSDGRQLQATSFSDVVWELTPSFEFSVGDFLKNLGDAIVAVLNDIAQAMTVAWTAVKEFAIDLFNGVKDLARQFGEAIKGVFDAVSDALEDVSKELDTWAAAIDDGDLGSFGDTVAGALRVFSDAVSIASNAVDGVVGFFSEDLFGKNIRNRRAEYVNPSRTDDKYNCKLQITKWEECQKYFAVDVGICDNKQSSPYPEPSCVRIRRKQLVKMKDDITRSQKEDKCRRDSEGRNSGLKTFSESNVDVAPTLQNVGIPSGSVASNSNDFCKTINYDGSVQSIEFNGQKEFNGASKSCVDLKDDATLSNSLNTFKIQLKNDYADESRGEQGLDKDSAMRDCYERTNPNTCANANAPRLSKGANFKYNAEITCDQDFNNLNLVTLFGQVDLITDDICTDTDLSHKEFEVDSRVDPLDDGCAPVEVKIRRFGVDCCEKETNEFIHFLKITSLPPTFDENQDLDAELTCDSNIHPSVTGVPTYQPGCSFGILELDIVDDSAFDDLTCKTTITRTFTVVQDACDDLSATFTQIITLTNDYVPEWDYFPPDVRVDVFADYGTDATGYPTVFQKCGASPVRMSYVDNIVEGRCFAERILTRTFTATDICGHTTSRSQTITITNDPLALPLGDKSLARLYGSLRARESNVDSPSCIFDSDICSIPGAPTDYVCGSSDDTEFSGYQQWLFERSDDPSFDLGALNKACECNNNDIQCDSGASLPQNLKIHYGVQVVYSASESDCNTTTSQPYENQRGSIEETTVPCNRRTPRRACPADAKILTGSHPVYNVFSINATDFANYRLFEISAPNTSRALINVKVNEEISVYIPSDAKGIKLSSPYGLTASDVLFNVPVGFNLTLNGRNHRPYFEFYGTVLNPSGTMELLLPFPDEYHWEGQIFAEEINSNMIIDCGHFGGFTTCVPEF